MEVAFPFDPNQPNKEVEFVKQQLETRLSTAMLVK